MIQTCRINISEVSKGTPRCAECGSAGQGTAVGAAEVVSASPQPNSGDSKGCYLGDCWWGQGPQPPLRTVSSGSGCALTRSLKRHPVTDQGPACIDPKVASAEVPPRLGCVWGGTGLCQASLYLGLISKESLQKHDTGPPLWVGPGSGSGRTPPPPPPPWALLGEHGTWPDMLSRACQEPGGQ